MILTKAENFNLYGIGVTLIIIAILSFLTWCLTTLSKLVKKSKLYKEEIRNWGKDLHSQTKPDLTIRQEAIQALQEINAWFIYKGYLPEAQVLNMIAENLSKESQVCLSLGHSQEEVLIYILRELNEVLTLMHHDMPSLYNLPGDKLNQLKNLITFAISDIMNFYQIPASKLNKHS